jgi:hypothetical protein
MARALRRSALTVALPALVGASTVLHWLAARRVPGLWIMPDEAIYAQRAIDLWRHGSLPLLHGEGAGYGVVYPFVAGLPFFRGDVDTGYASLKLLQALVVSLAAVPVLAYGRRVMAPSYAFVAAALTMASPLLLYAGMVMTEVVFYPLAALALLAVARAVATAATRDQLLALAAIALAVATRVQAVSFVAIFAAAAGVDALIAHDLRRLRRFWPVWSLLGLTAVAAAIAPGVFGAYAGTLSGGYPVGKCLDLAYEHLAYTTLSVGIVPVAATALMLTQRELDARARALLVVTATAVVVVSLQVGFFAGRYAPHLLGRDLASLPPILFLCFALWLARGAPRRGFAGAALGLAVLALVVLAPWNSLVTDQAFPDTFGVALWLDRQWQPANVIAVVAAAIFVATILVPRRAALLLPAAVLALLAADSVRASNLVVDRAAADQESTVGAPRDWVDASTKAPVAFVQDEKTTWPVAWQQRFWNEHISRIVSLPPAIVPGPIPQLHVAPAPDGRLPIAERYAVGDTQVAFVGAPIARQSLGPDNWALQLWQLEPPARVSFFTAGVKPNGDIEGYAAVHVYACRGGTLRLTLLSKQTDELRIVLGTKTVLDEHIGGEPVWHGRIPVPKSYRGEECVFGIEAGPLLGSTVITFDR